MVIALGLLVIFLSLGIWTRLKNDDGFELPTPQFLDLDGVKMAYYRQGKGPLIVLLHGLGASSYCWRYLFPLLAMDNEVIAFDLIGFGRSDKTIESQYILEDQGEWLRKAFHRLNLKPKLVVGSSMGGLLALWLARFEPNRIERVLALAPAAIGKRFAQRLHIWTRPLVWVGHSAWTLPWIVAIVTGSLRPLNRRSIKEYQRPFRDPGGTHASFHAGLAVFDSRLPGLLAGITAPVLILRGSWDVLVHRKIMIALCRTLPNASYRELPTAHHPQEHIPEKLADEIRAYLKS